MGVGHVAARILVAIGPAEVLILASFAILLTADSGTEFRARHQSTIESILDKQVGILRTLQYHSLPFARLHSIAP